MKIYEDALIAASLPEQGLLNGHITLTPKSQVTQLTQLSNEETEHLFFAASYAATVLFETLGAQGTNIVLNEEPLKIDVIARTPEDTWNHQWTPKPMDQHIMDEVVEKISFNMPLDGEPVTQQKTSVRQQKPGVSEHKKHEPTNTMGEEARENYLIRQLHRVP